MPTCLCHFFLYLFDDRNLVVVTNAVFTQEVKFHHTFVAIQLLMQSDVLNTKRAATHRVRRLSLLFLIASSQGQLFGSEDTEITTDAEVHAELFHHKVHSTHASQTTVKIYTRTNKKTFVTNEIRQKWQLKQFLA